MKNLLHKAVAIVALSLVFLGCSNDDSNEIITGTGNLRVEFDNSFGDNDLILSTQANTTSDGEAVKNQ